MAQAAHEYHIFDQVWSAVSKTIVSPSRGEDAKPLHLHPAAQSLQYEPQETRSCIFRCTAQEFGKMTDEDIRAVFSERHILVTGHPLAESWNWDVKSMQRLRAPWCTVEAQGAYINLR